MEYSFFYRKSLHTDHSYHKYGLTHIPPEEVKKWPTLNLTEALEEDGGG